MEPPPLNRGFPRADHPMAEATALAFSWAYQGLEPAGDRRDACLDAPRVFLSTLPAGRCERQCALAVGLVSVAVFAAAVPFAQVPLRPVWAFIPSYQAALVVNDLITAVVLFGQCKIVRSRALLLLASGYLFTACIAVVHTLTFPGLFAPSGLLGAGPQSTAWLYMFWHGGFPIFVIVYALRTKHGGETSLPGGCTSGAILASIAGVLVVVGGV